MCCAFAVLPSSSKFLLDIIYDSFIFNLLSPHTPSAPQRFVQFSFMMLTRRRICRQTDTICSFSFSTANIFKISVKQKLVGDSRTSTTRPESDGKRHNNNNNQNDIVFVKTNEETNRKDCSKIKVIHKLELRIHQFFGSSFMTFGFWHALCE